MKSKESNVNIFLSIDAIDGYQRTGKNIPRRARLRRRCASSSSLPVVFRLLFGMTDRQLVYARPVTSDQ